MAAPSAGEVGRALDDVGLVDRDQDPASPLGRELTRPAQQTFEEIGGLGPAGRTVHLGLGSQHTKVGAEGDLLVEVPDEAAGPTPRATHRGREPLGDRGDQIPSGGGLMGDHGPAQLAVTAALDLVEQHGLADPPVAEQGLAEPRGLRPCPQSSQRGCLRLGVGR